MNCCKKRKTIFCLFCNHSYGCIKCLLSDKFIECRCLEKTYNYKLAFLISKNAYRKQKVLVLPEYLYESEFIPFEIKEEHFSFIDESTYKEIERIVYIDLQIRKYDSDYNNKVITDEEYCDLILSSIKFQEDYYSYINNLKVLLVKKNEMLTPNEFLRIEEINYYGICRNLPIFNNNLRLYKPDNSII